MTLCHVGPQGCAPAPSITRYGLVDVQVCVPENWSDEAIIGFIDRAYGDPPGCWRIRTSDDLLQGCPVRNPCSKHFGFVHVTLDVITIGAAGDGFVVVEEPRPLPGAAEIVALYEAAFRVVHPGCCSEDLTRLCRAVADAAPFIDRMRTKVLVADNAQREAADRWWQRNEYDLVVNRDGEVSP